MQISSSGISAQSTNDKIVCAADCNLLEKSPAPKGCRAWCSDKLLVQAEALVELGHTAAGVHQLLSARKERVTLRADFYANILLRRTCLNYITAGAFNSSLLIIGMDSFLHCSGSPLSGTKVLFTKATVILPLFPDNCKHFLKKIPEPGFLASDGQKVKDWAVFPLRFVRKCRNF